VVRETEERIGAEQLEVGLRGGRRGTRRKRFDRTQVVVAGLEAVPRAGADRLNQRVRGAGVRPDRLESSAFIEAGEYFRGSDHRTGDGEPPIPAELFDPLLDLTDGCLLRMSGERQQAEGGG